MINFKIPENLEEMIGAAVSHYWDTRLSQQQKQRKSGKVDYGLRGAVTGGAQMDGFIELFTRLITSTGLDADFIQRKGSLELPGYFQPTTASAFITSDRDNGPEGIFSTPSEDLSVQNFAKALIAHVGGFIS